MARVTIKFLQSQVQVLSKVNSDKIEQNNEYFRHDLPECLNDGNRNR